MKKILIFGGTRFVGKKLLYHLINDKNIYPIVASRKEIDETEFILINRKNTKDLDSIISNYDIDLIIDFINYSGLDSKKLIDTILRYRKIPHLVTISTTYVYGNPEKLKINKTYSEKDFIATNYDFTLLDRPDIGYIEGKKNAEAYIARNYPLRKSTIIRFPIILGHDDHTKRTHFFNEIIGNQKQVSFSGRGKSSNYIFSDEAAEAIYFFIKKSIPGVFNIVLEPPLNEEQIFELYCNYYGREASEFIDIKSKNIRSPFFYSREFVIDDTKFRNQYSFGTLFQQALSRELKKMHL